MSSGQRQGMGGSFVATGAAADIKTPGFRPCKVELVSSAGVKFAWHEGMPDATANKTLAAGTSTIVASAGITPLATGFTIGADADANVNGQTVYWWCEE